MLSTVSVQGVRLKMDFGTYLASLREAKGLSLRALEKQADDLSHVYIWRLERRDRENPSDDAVNKLLSALRLTSREEELARLLAKTPVDDALFELILTRPDIAIEDVEPVATMSFRGKRPADAEGWLRAIEMVRSF